MEPTLTGMSRRHPGGGGGRGAGAGMIDGENLPVDGGSCAR